MSRSSYDFHFEPALIGATPFWLAARFSEPGIMRLLAEHGADPLFVQHSDEVSVNKGFKHKTEVTTALMAALGMGGGTAWVQPTGDRELLTLEAVKFALDAGVDVNAANTDGRTALAAREGPDVRQSCQVFGPEGRYVTQFRDQQGTPRIDRITRSACTQTEHAAERCALWTPKFMQFR